MVVGTDMVGALADVIFAIEGTAINGVYMNDIRTNYLIPTLEYFSQGCWSEEREYVCDESTGALYGIVVYHAADRLPSPCTDIYGPYSNPQRLMQMLDKLELVGGRGESHANVAEALATSLVCFEDMQLRREANVTTQKHCILICNSPPYLMPVAENPTYAGKTAEQLAGLYSEKNVNLTILSARKIPAMFKLYEKAGGDLSTVQTKNYAKDPRHLVLLKGFSLKERPVSPGNTNPGPGVDVTSRPPAARFPVYNPAQNPTRPTAQPRWPLPMQAPRPPPQFTQPQGPPPPPPASALIEQLTRPPTAIVSPFSNGGMAGMPQQPQGVQQPQIRMMHQMGSPAGGMANVQNMPGPGSIVPTVGVMGPGGATLMAGGMMVGGQQPSPGMMQQNPNQPMMTQMPQQGVMAQQATLLQQNPQNTMISQQPQPMQSQSMQSQSGRESIKIWQGILEWTEKLKSDAPKVSRQAPCQVSAQPKDGEPELKADSWPNKLFMQLMPKTLIGTIGSTYVKNSKSVLFHLQPCEAVEGLTKVMSTGFAGCVHFSSSSCDIKVLLLFYTPDKLAFLGFIPNDQAAFVNQLRKVIQQQKMSGTRGQQQQLGGMVAGVAGPGGMMGTSGMQQGGMQQGGLQQGGMQPGGMQQGGMQQGGMQQGGMQQGGMQQGGMQQGGMQPGGMQQGGMQQGGMQQGGMQPGMQTGPVRIQPGLGVQSQNPNMQPVMQPGPGGMQPNMSQGSVMQQNPGGMQASMPTNPGGMQPGLSNPPRLPTGMPPNSTGMQTTIQAGGGIQQGMPSAGGGIQPGMQGSQQDQNDRNNPYTEAARQENLKEMQRLQLALEASQKQELQYKQLEHKLRAQLQQGVNQPRMMRPALPNNPGLKHLLQQPNYRMQVGQQMRQGMQPNTPGPQQPQQYDDVSYDFLK